MTHIKDAIATRSIDVLDANGALSGNVSVRLGRPAQEPTGEWACAYEVTGLGFDRVVRVMGMDAIQALQAAMLVIGGTLAGTREAAEGRLRWAGSSDLGFPSPPEPPTGT